jgi:hypothetical protein
MAGDPNECRVQAASCWALAETLDAKAKEYLGVVARAWEQLAVEHESAQAFLRTMEAINEDLRARCSAAEPQPAAVEGNDLENCQRG